MKGEENLIPLSERTKDEQRKIQKKAGKASGEARREKKRFQSAVLAALDAITESGTTVLEEIIAAQLKRAMTGDTRAFETLRDTSGEKPTEKVEASVTNENIDRNANEHSDLTNDDFKNIIANAIYSPSEIFSANKEKPYFHFAKVIEFNSKVKPEIGLALLDVDENKDNFEIVHAHSIDVLRFDKKKKID